MNLTTVELKLGTVSYMPVIATLVVFSAPLRFPSFIESMMGEEPDECRGLLSAQATGLRVGQHVLVQLRLDGLLHVRRVLREPELARYELNSIAPSMLSP